MDSFQNTSNRIVNRVSKLFKNQQINFFIIMFLILMITCYPLLSSTLQYTVSILFSNPVVMVCCLILILAIGYFDIGIASLMLVLFFILLFGSANSFINLGTTTENRIEGFKTTTSNGDDINIAEDTEDTEETANTTETKQTTQTKQTKETKETKELDNIDRHISKISKTLTKSQSNLKKKEEKDKQLDERVNNIKDVVLGTINKIRNSNNDDYKRALLENKQAMLYEEHENNNIRDKGDSSSREDFKNTNKRNQSEKGKNARKGNRERFQTVEVRALDPSNEDDTNLLITKEILQDMLNRIEYNYESNKYLRKYIKHRVEEIIDINKLTEDE